MTFLQKKAEEKFGSIRKMAKALNLSPGTIHPVTSRHRRAWPKLRRQLSTALELNEQILFDENGWLREEQNDEYLR